MALQVHLLEAVEEGTQGAAGQDLQLAAVAAADALRAANTSQAHLVHMPSHVYVRVGRYVDAVHVRAPNPVRQYCIVSHQPCGHAFSAVSNIPCVMFPHPLFLLCSYSLPIAVFWRMHVGRYGGAVRMRPQCA